MREKKRSKAASKSRGTNPAAAQDLKAKAAVIASKPALTKEEKRVIAARMEEIRKYAGDSATVQNTIPYLVMHRDGICEVTENYFTATIQFFDVNYSLADFDEKNEIFSKYCDLLNSFDNTVKFEITIESQTRSKESLVREIRIPKQDDDFDEIRQEYSDMLTDKLIHSKLGEVRKYLTFGTVCHSYHDACSKLYGIRNSIVKLFAAFDVEARMLSGYERLETIYYSLNPYREQPFAFDWNAMLHAGMDTKDFIAPTSLKFYKQNFEIGDAVGAVWGINILAGELSDTILQDFLELQSLYCVNFHAEPLDQGTALKFVRHKLTSVNQMKVDEQKKASQAGYDPDILPAAIKMYIDDIEKLLDDLNSKNERLFHLSLSVRGYAHDKEKLKLLEEELKRIAVKNNCALFPFDYRQEQTLMSTLPLGVNLNPVSREMHTSGIAVFVPFSTRELFQDGQATYYGLNSISGNMIRANRTRLKNPNGLILGTPGSGKSFSVKREILDSFLTTSDDIIICDPEGEYYPLVRELKGQLIRIASDSEDFINPMDISIDNFTYENQLDVIGFKSNFLISFCEIIVGGRYGLSSEERSVIDKCVKRIYIDFIEHQPSVEKMPTLSDLQYELMAEGDVALRVVNSLEMFINGSQNLFNHRTNIDLSNRIICFDIKDLGEQLKKVGMLIVQDTVWNRVSSNRGSTRRTRYYIDEFHLLLKDEQTAKYSVEIWKRFRKWGGIPTGITQNVKDLLSSQEIENIFDDSDFVYMLNQAAGDRDILAEKLHISKELMKYVTGSEAGHGLIRYGKEILPFSDDFPTDTKMFRLMDTKPA